MKKKYYISSAIIDTFLNEGTKLYTVKYVEPLIQTSSHVTYEPKEEVIAMMENDSNIDELASRVVSERVRKELDARLQAFYAANNNIADWNSTNNHEIYYDENYASEKNPISDDDTEIPQMDEQEYYEGGNLEYVD